MKIGGINRSSPDRRGPLGRVAKASAGTTGTGSPAGPIPAASIEGAATSPTSFRTVASTRFSGHGGSPRPTRGGGASANRTVRELRVLQIRQSAREPRLAGRRIPDDRDRGAAQPARAIERMEARRVQHEHERHENLNGGDRRDDRDADPGGQAETRNRSVASRRLPCRLHLTGEDISAASDGLDDRRFARIDLDLSPETADLHVDAAVKRGARPPLREIEQLVSGEHALGAQPQRPGEGRSSPLVTSTTAPAGDRRTRAAGSSRHPLNS